MIGNLVVSAILAMVSQPDRSMDFTTDFATGEHLILTLENASFTIADGSTPMQFQGFYIDSNGNSSELNLNTTLGIVKAATEDCIETIAGPALSLGVSSDSSWIGLSQSSTTDPAGMVITEDLATGDISTLSITGDFADLEAALLAFHSLASYQLALSQTLAALVSEAGLVCTNGHTTLGECKNAANTVCGTGCVKPITFSVETNDDGDIIKSTCEFTCKDDC